MFLWTVSFSRDLAWCLKKEGVEGDSPQVPEGAKGLHECIFRQLIKSWDGLGDNGNFGDLIYNQPYFRMNKIDDNINQGDGGEEWIVENCLFERVKKEWKEQKEERLGNEKKYWYALL